MMRPLRRSLFRRLLAVQLLTSAAAWIAFSAWTLHTVYVAGDGYLDQDLNLMAQTMARTASTHASVDGMRAVVEQLASLNAEVTVPKMRTEEFAWQVWRADGSLLFQSTPDAGAARVPPLPPLPPGSVPAHRRVAVDGWVAHGASSPDGRVFAVAAYSKPALARLQQMLVLDAAQGYLWIMGLLALTLWLSARFGLRPLRALAAELSRRPAGDLQPLLSGKTYAELEPLAASLNRTMSDLRALIARERTFFADAAHELRTPLAALEAQAHLLAVAATPELRHAALQVLEAGVGRCAATLDKLLLLARLDAGHHAPVLRDTDLCALLRRRVAEHAPRTIANGSRLSYDGPAPLDAVCDPQQLEIALDCLIDNALRHTPSGSSITVTASTQPSGVRIDVIDDGPGIAAGDRERVFERFVKLGASGAGSGLGLSIVRRIVASHGGTVQVLDAAPGVGCLVRIDLPRRHIPGVAGSA